jgi:hypothetical protein
VDADGLLRDTRLTSPDAVIVDIKMMPPTQHRRPLVREMAGFRCLVMDRPGWV